MRMYNGCGPMFLCRADWPERLFSAMVADLVDDCNVLAPVELYEQADRIARQFMRERGHILGA
jgi:hypothetical protein